MPCRFCLDLERVSIRVPPPDRQPNLFLPYLKTSPAPRSSEATESTMDRVSADAAPEHRPWSDVPWRTIIGSIGVVALAALSALLLYIASRIVILIVIAGFFAVVLGRPVAWTQKRFKLRRGAAIGAVMVLFVVTLGGLLALFIMPVRTQLVATITDLPGTVQEAAKGRGSVGHLVAKLRLENLVRDNQTTLSRAAKSVQESLPALVRSAIQTTLSTVTVILMTCLMLSQSDAIGRNATKAVPIRHREWVSRVSVDAAKAVSGYMIGNLIISLCAGVAAFVCLIALGVKSAAVLALWVALADLIPLVGATIGASAAVIAAFFVSPTAGIVAFVYFVLYQQFENSVLQIQVMSRTVRVNPLIVLLSVLLGVELFGVIGALLAVPFAGALSVVVKELWRHRPSNGDELIVITNARFDTATEPERHWYNRFKRGPHVNNSRPG